MAVRELRIYPDSILREVCREVDKFGPELNQLFDDLAESMYAQKGVGLAAPQIGVALRAIVVDVDQKEGTPRLLELSNPEVVEVSEETVDFEEGCLSFPEEAETVVRPATVTVKACDRQGTPIEITAQGLLATALQHEIDHLNGVLFIDHLSRLKRSLVERRMKKRMKTASGKEP